MPTLYIWEYLVFKNILFFSSCIVPFQATTDIQHVDSRSVQALFLQVLCLKCVMSSTMGFTLKFMWQSKTIAIAYIILVDSLKPLTKEAPQREVHIRSFGFVWSIIPLSVIIHLYYILHTHTHTQIYTYI